MRHEVIWDSLYRYHIKRADGILVHFADVQGQAENHAYNMQLLNETLDKYEAALSKISLLEQEKAHATDNGEI